jgi:hypothetical protein
MKRVLGIAAAATLALSVAATAQETKKPPAEHTMAGCVQKGATATQGVVQSTAEKGPKLIGIVESSATLAPHVGHKVEVTGTAVPTAEAEAMKPAPPKADHYMKITAVKMVSATCP